MKINSILVLFLTLLFCNSCVSKQIVLNKNYIKGPIVLNGTISKVEVIDKRLKTNRDHLLIQDYNSTGQQDVATPLLTESQKRSIENQIYQSFKSSNFALKVKCSFVDGIQGYKVGALLTSNFVKVSFKIELFDLADQLIRDNISNVYLHVNTITSDYEYLDKLYNKAITVAIYNCLNELQE